MTKKPDEVAVEEAAVNAEITAAHAEKAAETAAEAERDLADVTKEDPNARLCPHCNGEMTKHTDADPIKAGAWHCDSCGCCFRGNKLRDGHPGCDRA